MAYIHASSTQSIIILVMVIVLTKIYRVYTSPLAHLPGPAISKWTGLVLQMFAGNRPHYVQKLHQQAVVRAHCSNLPNELDVSDSEEAKGIHNVASRFYKDQFYEHIGRPSPKTLFSSTNPQFHVYQRRLLGGPMSETSIRQHEPTVAQKLKLCVDQMKSQYSLDLEMVSTLTIIRTTFLFLPQVAEYVPLPYSKQAAQYKKLVETYGDDVKPTLFTKLINKGHHEAGSDTSAISLTYLVWAVCKPPPPSEIRWLLKLQPSGMISQTRMCALYRIHAGSSMRHCDYTRCAWGVAMSGATRRRETG
ncbi:uncharacterized protein ATNIH1004_001837 [Aspergillus tanneri]|uniref:Uncharacterized protein n=1 Tax=Aspergillus tanneri TaxID=1220188 RepID=A0A5M9N1F8_9EURO|nr:uncharacterized protein ATNIH1004_001837 [Aspergillus tanneri]KAA8652928.1 hypothetical protein ATNIH1004_001837 [Aspergillus tanneri]